MPTLIFFQGGHLPTLLPPCRRPWIQGQGQGHEPIQGSSIENLQSREVDRQSPTGLIFLIVFSQRI